MELSSVMCLRAIVFAGAAGLAVARTAARDRPNILMITTDDVGYFNVGAYNHGMMGVPTPHIDRLAKEGMLFTDHYSEPTCTPGRAAFITGQRPIRTGLTTVGMAGSPIGLDARDPTLAEVLKPLGYRCAQFGKNHLGDRNEHLPTVHGFDEFYGNLYHLNTEEEPEAFPRREGDDVGGRRARADAGALAGDAPSARNVYIYYNESQLTAIRIGNWKSHMLEREGFFDYNRPSARIFNLRMDPFEKQEGWKSEEIGMRLGVAWGGQVQDALGAWFTLFEAYPPRRKGGTLTPSASDFE